MVSWKTVPVFDYGHWQWHTEAVDPKGTKCLCQHGNYLQLKRTKCTSSMRKSPLFIKFPPNLAQDWLKISEKEVWKCKFWFILSFSSLGAGTMCRYFEPGAGETCLLVFPVSMSLGISYFSCVLNFEGHGNILDL